MIKKIHTKSSPKAIGAYSQGIIAGQLIFTSGQIPLVPNTNKIINGSIEDEVVQVLNNIDNILVKGGGSLHTVVKFTVYVINIDFFPLVNKVFKEKLSVNLPARSVVEVSKLPMNANIEIDAIGIVQ